MKKKKNSMISEIIANQVSFYGKSFDAFIIGTSIMGKPEKDETGNKIKSPAILKIRPEKVL